MTSAHDFSPGEMRDKYGQGDSYVSGPAKRPSCPGLRFYSLLVAGPVRWLCGLAARGECDDYAWIFGSAWVGDVVENSGGRLDIRGMSNINAAGGPCVFIANHMSTLETFLLPAMIRPRRMPLTFVVKTSLISMPVFGPLMRSRKPITVGRTNPRADLAAVMEGGVERLDRGVSIIVFPQSTRSTYFDPRSFSSIGVKLARQAGVPIVPLALKTDFWGIGRKIKELGKIRPDLPVRFLFGRPLRVEGNGKKEQAEICQFIANNLTAWQSGDGVNG